MSVSGVFPTPYGECSFKYVEYDVVIAGELQFGRYPVRLANFWMHRRDNGSWHRATTLGPVSLTTANDGKSVWIDTPCSPISALQGLTTAALHRHLADVRDAWRRFIAANHPIHNAQRQELAKSRLRHFHREREAALSVLAMIDRRIKVVEEVIASDDVDAAWLEADKHWPQW